MLDLYQLKPGDRVRTTEGNVAEVLDATQDGQWIQVRYLESPDNPDLVGTKDLCHEDELREVVRKSAEPIDSIL